MDKNQVEDTRSFVEIFALLQQQYLFSRALVSIMNILQKRSNSNIYFCFGVFII